MFSFRSAVETGEYLFTSLNPAKLPQGLTPAAAASLARLRDLYEAALPQSHLEDGVVIVAIRKQPQIDFLPIVDEARRVLDDGNQEFAPVDLSQITLPTEKAAMFVGQDHGHAFAEAPDPPPAPPVVRTETHFEEEAEEPDRGNFLAAQSHRARSASSRSRRRSRRQSAPRREDAAKPSKSAAPPPKQAARRPRPQAGSRRSRSPAAAANAGKKGVEGARRRSRQAAAGSRNPAVAG